MPRRAGGAPMLPQPATIMSAAAASIGFAITVVNMGRYLSGL